MFRRSVLALAVGASALAGGTFALAAVKHHVSQTVKTSSISQSANYPSPGSRNTSAGTVTGSLGSGAVIQKLVITGHPTVTTYTFKVTGTVFYAHGTTRASASGTATAQTNGSAAVSGHGHYTGGTGLYRGARGKFTFTGTIPPPNPTGPAPLVAHVSGSISY
jgi:hypothetical protein